MVVCVSDVLRHQTGGVIDALVEYEDVMVAEEEVAAVTAAVEALNPWHSTTGVAHENTCKAWGVEMLNSGIPREILDIQRELRGVLIRYFKGAKKACARAVVVLAKSSALRLPEFACEAAGSSSSAAVAAIEDNHGQLITGESVRG